MKFVLMMAAVLNVLGIVFYVILSANQAVFLAVNGIFPRPFFWLTVTALGDGAIAGCIFYVLFIKSSDLLAKGLLGLLLWAFILAFFRTTVIGINSQHCAK